MSRLSAEWKPSSAASSRLQQLAQAPFLVAVREAFPYAFGALVAAFAVLLAILHAPFPARISLALLPAFGVMACALAVALPITLARRARFAPVRLTIATMVCFAVALPRPSGPDVITYLREVGATGIFLAIIMTGLAAAAIALIRLPRQARDDTKRTWDDGAARDSIGAALAAVVIAALVFGAHVDISQSVTLALQPLAKLGDSYLAFVSIVAVEMLLWFIGVHGPAMLAAIVTPVYLTMQMQNTAAFSAHEPLPHVVVASLFLFVFPGGSGATLPLAALLAISRSVRLRRVGRLVLLPSIANVNEPLIFGLPIVFNPYFALPFVGVPIVLATITYVAVAFGAVSRPAFYVPSSLPAPLSTYLATLDLRALALLGVNVAVALALYFPFVRAYERHLERTA